MYVDDFLILAPKGEIRTGVVEALQCLWRFGAERTLSSSTSLTFLGIDWNMKSNGDIVLSQTRFIEELLAKHKMSSCKPLKAITIDRPPETDDIPSPEALTELQGFAGSFNWLGTRTRPDVAYYVSLLVSCASKQSAWSRDLAHKVLRYLANTAHQGLTMSASGSEDDMKIYTDAGFAGADTKSQNGMIICWGGSIITWRSSRAALSALSTAEAELCSAALGWQVGEGVRYLLSTLLIFPKHLEILIDNKAALTTASIGATWRTRYYAVRAQRLLEEHQAGKIVLSYCPTKLMVADALTKLATADAISVILAAMDSQLPSHSAVFGSSSDTPGHAKRSSMAADGWTLQPSCRRVGEPSDGNAEFPTVSTKAIYTWADIAPGILHPGVANKDPKWRLILEDMYSRWSSPQTAAKLPDILEKYDDWPLLYSAFVQRHGISFEDLRGVFTRTLASSSSTSARASRFPAPPDEAEKPAPKQKEHIFDKPRPPVMIDRALYGSRSAPRDFEFETKLKPEDVKDEADAVVDTAMRAEIATSAQPPPYVEDLEDFEPDVERGPVVDLKAEHETADKQDESPASQDEMPEKEESQVTKKK